MATPRSETSPASARVIRNDEEAIAVARELAASFGREAAARDRDRRLPYAELEEFSNSGLWAVTVPKKYGGAGVSFATVTEIFRLISAVDPSIGQIPQNHFGVLDILEQSGTDEQKRLFYAEVLAGKRLGNGFAERGTKHVLDLKTRLQRDGDGYRLNGQKFYSTGALFAHWVPVLALDEEERAVLAFLPRDTEGLTITDDWDGFGQRTTASGTVTVENVRVPVRYVVAAYRAYERPTRNGPVCQIIQAAIDAGIGRGALADTLTFVRERSRPWVDSGVARAAEDPLVIRDVGDLSVRLHAAEALLLRAAHVLDGLPAEPTEEEVARASVAVAEAKVLTTEIALLAGSKLFELAGTQATLGEHNLDRHWRNARTHTLHDPVRWKYHLIGNYVLNQVAPPRHAWN